MPTDDDRLGVALQRILVNPVQPPEAAHGFVWARVGELFLLEVGFFDMLEAHSAFRAAKETGTSQELNLFVNHRFVLSKEGVAQLAQAVKEMEQEVERRAADATPGI